MDTEWRITCCNLAAVEIAGVPRNEALGRPCREVFRSNIGRAKTFDSSSA